jgi:hypothetical protein
MNEKKEEKKEKRCRLAGWRNRNPSGIYSSSNSEEVSASQPHRSPIEHSNLNRINPKKKRKNE